MATPFSRTLTAVEVDGNGRVLLGTIATAFVAALGVLWLTLSRVSVFVASEAARIEVQQKAHSVDAPVSARVVSVSEKFRLGRGVRAGEPLLELDATLEKVEYERAKALCDVRNHTKEVELAALDAAEKAFASERSATSIASRATRSRRRAAEEAARAAEEDRKIAEALENQTLATHREVIKAAGEARQRRAEAVAVGLEGRQSVADRRLRVLDRQAEIERRRIEIASLSIDIAQCEEDQKRFSYEVQRRTITAPVEGVIAEITPIAPGTVLVAPQRVAVVVPLDRPHVVAEMTPGPTVGRVRPGQTTRIALDSFPWTQYGFVEGVVTSVATESQNGRVRVECSIDRVPVGVPTQHGLLGTLEVRVEEVSPITVLLRTLGQSLLAPSGTPATAAPSAPAQNSPVP